MNLLAPTTNFTYASPEDAQWLRALIHAIEQVTGKTYTTLRAFAEAR